MRTLALCRLPQIAPYQAEEIQYNSNRALTLSRELRLQKQARYCC